MTPETIKRLRDALEAARLIQRRLSGHSKADYDADPWMRSAAERQLEIIGEALNHVRRLAPELEEHIPDIHGWVSMRHFIAHVYDGVDQEVVWDTMERELPILIERIGTLLENQP